MRPEVYPVFWTSGEVKTIQSSSANREQETDMSKRRKHSSELKARVALEAIAGIKTASEIASEYEIHPGQVSQ